MAMASPATYGLLGMLAVRPWTGYELTRQVRRSLRFVWPNSEGHLYREQKRLVRLGWASVTQEPAGRRTRNRYEITPAGREALRAWMATEPGEPQFQVEGILRIFHGDQAEPEDMLRSMQATAAAARSMLAEMTGFASEYLEPGGPMDLLERRVGGPDSERVEFHGRPMFPERLPAVALVIDVTTQMLATLAEFFEEASVEVASWQEAPESEGNNATRRRLESVLTRSNGGRPR